MFAASVTERQLMSITALALSGICCILVMLSEFSLYKSQTKELVIIFLSFISGSIYAISLTYTSEKCVKTVIFKKIKVAPLSCDIKINSIETGVIYLMPVDHVFISEFV